LSSIFYIGFISNGWLIVLGLWILYFEGLYKQDYLKKTLYSLQNILERIIDSTFSSSNIQFANDNGFLWN
jgi:hypothetical protein